MFTQDLLAQPMFTACDPVTLPCLYSVAPYLHPVTSEALLPVDVFVFQHLLLSAPLLLGSKFKMKCSHKRKIKKTQVKQDTYILAYFC